MWTIDDRKKRNLRYFKDTGTWAKPRDWQLGPYVSVRNDPAYASLSQLTRIEATRGDGFGLVNITHAHVHSAAGNPFLSVSEGYIRLLGWLLEIGPAKVAPNEDLRVRRAPIKHDLRLPNGTTIEEGRTWFDVRSFVTDGARKFCLPTIAREFGGEFTLWGLVLKLTGKARGQYRRCGRFHVTVGWASAFFMGQATSVRLAKDEYEAEAKLGSYQIQIV